LLDVEDKVIEIPHNALADVNTAVFGSNLLTTWITDPAGTVLAGIDLDPVMVEPATDEI
jgi:hypothetical protein